jgi:hypothetical protein
VPTTPVVVVTVVTVMLMLSVFMVAMMIMVSTSSSVFKVTAIQVFIVVPGSVRVVADSVRFLVVTSDSVVFEIVTDSIGFLFKIGIDPVIGSTVH